MSACKKFTMRACRFGCRPTPSRKTTPLVSLWRDELFEHLPFFNFKEYFQVIFIYSGRIAFYALHGRDGIWHWQFTAQSVEVISQLEERRTMIEIPEAGGRMLSVWGANVLDGISVECEEQIKEHMVAVWICSRRVWFMPEMPTPSCFCWVSAYGKEGNRFGQRWALISAQVHVVRRTGDSFVGSEPFMFLLRLALFPAIPPMPVYPSVLASFYLYCLIERPSNFYFYLCRSFIGILDRALYLIQLSFMAFCLYFIRHPISFCFLSYFLGEMTTKIRHGFIITWRL